jgi:hypothetical protein
MRHGIVAWCGGCGEGRPRRCGEWVGPDADRLEDSEQNQLYAPERYGVGRTERRGDAVNICTVTLARSRRPG